VTLKGQKNHYNVKFLKGYGISVNLKENKLILKNGYDYFTKQQEQEEWFVTNYYPKII
jgi:CRISP-associated protein Cas1